MIGIRADGGARAGLGHLGRCAALAQAFARLGARPVFLDVPAECRGWVEERGFGLARTASRRWDIIVADSYRFAPRDLKDLRRAARTLLVIDDFGTFSAPCDWVLNGHLYAPGLSHRAPPGAGLLLGPKFHPMRSEYWTRPRPKSFPARIRRLLVTLGGGDSGPLLTRTLRAARAALPRAELHVVLGPLAASRPELSGPGIVLYRGLPSLKALIERCDAAVSAAGQTLYEVAFAGTPAVAVLRGPDQEGNFRSMTAARAALSGGPLTAALRRLDKNVALRRAMSERGRSLLDGRGALRVARLLLGER